MAEEDTTPGSTGPAKPIRTRGLSMVYRTDILKRKRKALDGLDLEIEPGEIFGYLGANGAGKTTTLKLLVGLLRPTAGEAWILGRSTGEVASRRPVGFLPENPFFYEYLSAKEAVDFYASLSGMGRADRARRTAEVLELVGLGGTEEGRIGSFSKGMRQRLGLAQALVHEPKVLILDEPMSGLDPIGRRDVREIILAQRDLGRTVFFSSHILADVEAICDRVGILAQGRLAETGPLENILAREITAIDVVVEGASVEAVPEDLAADTTMRVIETENGFEITVADYETAYRVVDAAEAAGGKLRALTPRGESLEQYFMRTQAGGRGGEGAAGAAEPGAPPEGGSPG